MRLSAMQTLDAPHRIQRDVLPGRAAVLGLEGLGWSGMTLAIDGRAVVPLRHLIVRQENKVLAGGRAAQAGEQADVLAGENVLTEAGE